MEKLAEMLAVSLEILLNILREHEALSTIDLIAKASELTNQLCANREVKQR